MECLAKLHASQISTAWAISNHALHACLCVCVADGQPDFHALLNMRRVRPSSMGRLGGEHVSVHLCVKIVQSNRLDAQEALIVSV